MDLRATASNRDAIGAKVKVFATINGKPVWQLREISTGAGRWSQPLRAHFGLGNATNIEVLRVEWPSGTVQEVKNVAAKQIVTVTEPPRWKATMEAGGPKFVLNGGRGIMHNVEGSEDLKSWQPVKTVAATNINGAIDLGAIERGARHRFFRALRSGP